MIRLRFLAISVAPPVLWLMAATLATAATYYVAPTGNDAAPGTLAQPFATVSHAVAVLQTGDTLQVRAGEYHGAVTLTSSGTAAAPIVIEAYSGETPTLIGSAPVAGPWTLHAGFIYRTPWPSQPQQVFCDGRLLNEARWPNIPVTDNAHERGSARTDAGDMTSLTCATLPRVDLTGAWVHIQSGVSWVGYSRQIAAQDQTAGRLSWVSPINQLTELIPRRDDRFFVFGCLALLDVPGEWWWDPVARQLYVWTPDGAPPAARVEAGDASAVLDLSTRAYVTVRGLNARGGWFDLRNCTYCTVEDCHLWAPNWLRTFDGYSIWPQSNLGGIDVSGSANVVKGGSVRLAGRSGVHLTGTNNTVRGMTVEDCGLNWTNNAGINLENSTGNVVEDCTVRRISGTGIFLYQGSRALRNLVEDCAIDFEDCGNINAWSTDGLGTEIAWNVVRGNPSRWGAGIYLDAGSRNFYVHDNFVEDIAWNGINVTGPLHVAHNTFINVQHQGIALVPQSSTDGVDMSSGLLEHNLAAEPFPIVVALRQPPSLIPDFDQYQTTVPLAPMPGPRRVEILWTDLHQPGWGPRGAPLDLSIVNGLDFTFESPAIAFDYTITNLRLLPVGQTGDNGAVPVTGTTWTIASRGSSTCSLTASGPATWGIHGVSDYRGSTTLIAPLPAALTNVTAYRGVAFELGGTAKRDYTFQGYQDVDNGAEALPSRGARLPAVVGADPTTAWPRGGPLALPAMAWVPFVAGVNGRYSPPVTAPAGAKFSADGLPSWASLDPITGVISGTPTTAAGTFAPVTLRVTDGAGHAAVETVQLLVAAPGGDLAIANFSVRAQALAGDNVLIPAVTVGGSGSRRYLFRAAGPVLATFGLVGFLADPQMTLVRLGKSPTENQDLATNDDWGASADLTALNAAVHATGAFGFPEGSRDAALVVDLAPGPYTAVVRGTGASTGVALAEVYDTGVGTGGPLDNISARALVGTGENIAIIGLVLKGGGSRRLLIRGVGPGLAAYGLQDRLLADPEITLYAGSDILAQNDDWETGPDAAAIAAVTRAVGGFPLASGSHDAVLLPTLVSGSYTIHLSGKNGATGVALAEIYLVNGE